MRLETFFEKFELFAEAPGAIPAMRELVLQLAVRGALTERIDGESSRRQLEIAEKFRIQRGKREEPDVGDIPFSIPSNWGWVAVGDSMEMVNGKAFKPEDWSAEGTPIIRIQNLNNKNSSFNRCNTDADTKIHVHDGDFLISWSGTPGTSFGAFIWTRGFAYLNQHIFRCALIDGIFTKEFLRLAVNARLDKMISHAQGAVGLRHITKGRLESIRLPLPPISEQSRIVAKVNELMALCDQLEAQQHERDAQRAKLARASLARFAEAPTQANLSSLFHPSYNITPVDLRKSILALAIQGKLVTQDPKNEPSECLNSKLPNELREIAEKVGARFSVADALIESNHDLSTGWGLASIQSIGITQTGTTPSKSEPIYSGHDVPFIKPGDIQGDIIDYDNEGLSADGLSVGRMIPKNSVLMVSIGGSIGKTAMVDRAVSCNQQINTISIAESIDPRFVLIAMRSSNFQNEVMRRAAQGTLPIISKGKWETIRIPIPPLAEQRQIVAKVNQLMAFVDELEAQLVASRASTSNLLTALVDELTT